MVLSAALLLIVVDVSIDGTLMAGFILALITFLSVVLFICYDRFVFNSMVSGAGRGPGVGIGLGVEVGVAVGVGVDVGVDIGVGVTLGVAVGVAVDVAVGLGLGVGVAPGIISDKSRC
jgi:hypothetical protein